MSEAIGLLWEKGEILYKDGDILEALLNFQRAKSLLIVESNSNYANKVCTRTDSYILV
jgi:hypothetical protein